MIRQALIDAARHSRLRGPAMRTVAVLGVTFALAAPVAASASEMVTYGYDTKGRLIQVSHTGSVNNGLTATYAYDAADNRTQATVIGAHSPIVIVPLGGFRLIPLR